MHQEEKPAYLMAMVVCAMADIAGMQAANQERIHRGESLAYPEEAFAAVADKYGIHHNAVLGLFQG